MNLAYQSHAQFEALQPGECTVRPCRQEDRTWWNLWLRVYRHDRPVDLILIGVPIQPRGSYAEHGPGGRTWGLADLGDGRWQVAPSINVLADARGDVDRAHPGPHAQPSIWHAPPHGRRGPGWRAVAMSVYGCAPLPLDAGARGRRPIEPFRR